MKIFIFALVAITAPLVSLASDCTEYDKFTDTPMSEMKSMVESKQATIIDVNSMDSYKKAHIPGAIHFASNKEKMAQLLPQDKSTLIIAYCGGKMCTAWQRAARLACEQGYTNIRHFSEGIKGWLGNS
jgi:rhodanese-related sulfurtransferase